jgi:hypothetical protein
MPWQTDQRSGVAAKSWATQWAQIIATPWAEHMAYKMHQRDTDNVTGKIIAWAGMPICKVVGMWRRVFGASTQPAGFGKVLMLISVFVLLYLIAKCGQLFQGKRK